MNAPAWFRALPWLALAGPALGQGAAAQPSPAALPPYRVDYGVSANIRIGGSPLHGAMVPLETAFLRFHPDAQFTNDFAINSEGCIGALCTGVAEIATAGDEAKLSDRMQFYFVNHYVPQEISVATGGYEAKGTLWPAAILVNRDNPIEHVTMDELDRIFGSERTGGWDVGDNPQHNVLYSTRYARGPGTNIRRWGQLGLGGDWASRKIQTYGFVAPGFATYFQRRVLHWSNKYNPNFRGFVMEKQAEAGNAGVPIESDNMYEELSHDKYGMAWGAMVDARRYPQLKAIAVAPGKTDHYVAYTPENVANRSYPLVRDAYVYVNHAPGVPLDPKVREFMRFVLSREGQAILAQAGYYPLPPAYLEQQRRKLN